MFLHEIILLYLIKKLFIYFILILILYYLILKIFYGGPCILSDIWAKFHKENIIKLIIKIKEKII